MSRGPEGRFQDRLLDTLRKQGLVCQKFNDHFSEGIPDVLAVMPVVPPNYVGPRGFWMELKAIADWPKRQTSALPKDSRPTIAQERWAKSFATPEYPCYFVLGTPDGWVAIDHTAIDYLWILPWQKVRAMASKEPPTAGRILRAIHAD